MLNAVLTILASLASGAIGAFLVYRFHLPKVEARVRAELTEWRIGVDQWLAQTYVQVDNDLKRRLNEFEQKVSSELRAGLADAEQTARNRMDAQIRGATERLRKAADEQLTAKKTELEAFVQTELGAAILQLTEAKEREPKLEGVTTDKPKTETEEKEKSRGVEGTFCM